MRGSGARRQRRIGARALRTAGRCGRAAPRAGGRPSPACATGTASPPGQGARARPAARPRPPGPRPGNNPGRPNQVRSGPRAARRRSRPLAQGGTSRSIRSGRPPRASNGDRPRGRMPAAREHRREDRPPRCRAPVRGRRDANRSSAGGQLGRSAHLGRRGPKARVAGRWRGSITKEARPLARRGRQRARPLRFEAMRQERWGDLQKAKARPATSG